MGLLSGALGVGLLVGLETYAWMRFGTSAIALAIGWTLSLTAGLAAVAVAATLAYSILAGLISWDPVGLLDDSSEAASASTSDCDPNYRGACLDPDAEDYDCEGEAATVRNTPDS